MIFTNNNFILSTKNKQDNCDHKDRYIKLLKVTATCETTVEACTICKKHLSEPKTDCS